jgi:hypothetical protein
MWHLSQTGFDMICEHFTQRFCIPPCLYAMIYRSTSNININGVANHTNTNNLELQHVTLF